MGQLQEIFSKPVDLRKLIAKISFDPDLLERSALEQPGLYLEASRYRTLKMRRKAQAFSNRELVKASLDIEYRKKKGDNKPTEGALKASVAFDKRMTEAQDALDRAQEEEKWAEALVEVFRQRLSVLKIITEIRTAEISSEIRHAKESMAVDAMRKSAEKARSRFDREG